jgi:hypothetical protein
MGRISPLEMNDMGASVAMQIDAGESRHKK